MWKKKNYVIRIHINRGRYSDKFVLMSSIYIYIYIRFSGGHPRSKTGLWKICRNVAISYRGGRSETGPGTVVSSSDYFRTGKLGRIDHGYPAALPEFRKFTDRSVYRRSYNWRDTNDRLQLYMLCPTLWSLIMSS